MGPDEGSPPPTIRATLAEETTGNGWNRGSSRRGALHAGAIALLAALGLREVTAKQDRVTSEQHRDARGYDHGKRGKRGKTGPGGASGGSGPQGGKGDQGETGPGGSKGDAGPPGPPGETGPPGNPGVLWARVDRSGTIIGQKGVTSVSRLDTGSYVVTFSVDVSACAVTLTPITQPIPFDLRRDPVETRLLTFGTDAQVELRRGTSDTDAEFSIVATCA